MIKVVGMAACMDSTVEVDPWVPLDVTWHPRPKGPLLYLRVSGNRGGEIEFKVDQRTGRLVELVIIDSPPTIKAVARTVVPGWSLNQVPIIDRSLWEWRENPDYAETKNAVATMTESLGLIGGSGATTLVVCDAETASYLECKGVRVGISDDGFITEISAESGSS